MNETNTPSRTTLSLHLPIPSPQRALTTVYLMNNLPHNLPHNLPKSRRAHVPTILTLQRSIGDCADEVTWLSYISISESPTPSRAGTGA
ncbi:hypothetical protein LTS18_003250 [Coniosporium uncinatum]|uniref:Uncharacterized protein n=1 Tax=Coniosporium uncinatum TaxID=93489 RepID=A0ACC3DTR2_9PEZI|nr:hypothetical protein LTS18_003250 [Coniosporium uncinatum]